MAKTKNSMQTSLETATKESAAKTYEQLVAEISSGLKNIQGHYVQIALALNTIKKNRLYTCEGFKNIYDFAKAKYHLSRGTCSEYINVAEKLCVEGEKRLGELKPEYQDYCMSQLAVLQSMSDECRQKATPDMTVSELKALKQEFKKKAEEQEPEIDEIPDNITSYPICHAFDIDELFSRKSKRQMMLYWKKILAKYNYKRPKLVVKVEFYEKDVEA